MDSSPATPSRSRSPSPMTPDSSDTPDTIALRSALQPDPWFTQKTHPITGLDDNEMLRLDELIQDGVYDDSPSPFLSISNQQLVHADTNTSLSLYSSPFLVSPQNGLVGVTKPVPPPPAHPRKRDLALADQKVVFPLKESCYNLPIITPNLSASGTKSRVETQVRVNLDLADAPCSSLPSSSGGTLQYNRVGSWNWLQLPPGTATKKRTRKQGKIEPEPCDILYLSASVTCATPPHNAVESCSSCRNREAKRLTRKLASRRPRPGSPCPEDTTSLIQFNTSEILDFSSGTTVLPLRITCYCRHHREKVGFRVRLALSNWQGRVVAQGVTPPIMITDDHKTVPKSAVMGMGPGSDWGVLPVQPGLATPLVSSPTQGQNGSQSPTETKAPSKRRQTPPASVGAAKPKSKRAKPYDANSHCRTSQGFSRETSIGASSVQASPLLSSSSSSFNGLPLPPHTPSPHLPYSVPRAACPPPIADTDMGVNMDIGVLTSPDPINATAGADADALLRSFLFFPTQPQVTPVPTPPPHLKPMIHRLIPSNGPTHGGTEITVLGSNFPLVPFTGSSSNPGNINQPGNAQGQNQGSLRVVFGDAGCACWTERWSENTLVCVSPPRAMPGAVRVWLEWGEQGSGNGGVETSDVGIFGAAGAGSVFTYADETDRALMELALQVVGLKMTGKIEDAKNVAMRIVGTSGDSSGGAGNGNAGNDVGMNMMSTSSSSSVPVRYIRSQLVNEDLERVLLEFLELLHTPTPSPSSNEGTISIGLALSHTTPSGQTLLHLASFLGFAQLVAWLVRAGADTRAKDRGGRTPLDLAICADREECARVLDEADTSEREDELDARAGDSESGVASQEDSWSEAEDEEATWGDAEEEYEDARPAMFRRRAVGRQDWRSSALSGEKVDDNLHSSEIHDTASESKFDGTHESFPDEKCGEDKQDPNEKQTASFVDMIQRTLIQLYNTPNMPNIPRPPLPNIQMPPLPNIHMPPLPNIPNLPNFIPVLPVLIPMPGWPSFRSKINEGAEATEDAAGGQEWRGMWERWMALAIATATMQRQQQGQEEEAPPVYTPHEEKQMLFDLVAEKEEQDVRRVPQVIAGTSRRVGYALGPITDQEVKAFAYRPTPKHARKLKKKHDRMLLMFWLPILFLSLIWAIYTAFQSIFHPLLQFAQEALPFGAIGMRR